MTLEVDRDVLLAALRRVVDVVEARNTIPILSNLLIDAKDGEITIAGTDLDIQVSARAPATGDLTTTVGAQKLLAAVSSFAPGALTIAPVEGRSAVTIKRGRSVRTLQTLAATDFPHRAQIDATPFEIGAPSLSRLLDTAGIAQSSEETRYYLCGVFMHVADGKLVAAATDGFRLVRTAAVLPAGAEGMPDSIIPSKAVGIVRKLLQKQEGKVSFACSDNAVVVRVGDTEVLSKLVAHTYPDYSRVIAPPSQHVVTAMRDALLEPAAAVVSVVDAEGERAKYRTVILDLEGETPEVSAQDSTGTSAREPLDAQIEGGAIKIGVNHRYFASVLNIFAESGTLTISFADARAPMRITGDKDPDLIAIIMPMRA